MVIVCPFSFWPLSCMSFDGRSRITHVLGHCVVCLSMDGVVLRMF